MIRSSMLRKILLGFVLASATGAGSFAAQCVPDPNPICFQIFAPVKCNDGATYTNQCYADAACAHGCHPV